MGGRGHSQAGGGGAGKAYGIRRENEFGAEPRGAWTSTDREQTLLILLGKDRLKKKNTDWGERGRGGKLKGRSILQPSTILRTYCHSTSGERKQGY